MTHHERLAIDPAGAFARVRESFTPISCEEAAVTPAPRKSIACSILVCKDHVIP
jgi:hypothetical protein